MNFIKDFGIELIDNETEIVAYKGFNKDMTCKGFQYEEGKEYETDIADICKDGFHACIYPLDVFGYYNPAMSIYHKVILSGCFSVNTDDECDSKICATKIKICEELTIQDLQKASKEFIKSHITEDKASSNTGNRSSSSNTGDRSSSSNTGDYSSSSNIGNYSSSSNTGNRSSSSNTGDYSSSSNTGDYSSSSNTGYYSSSSNTGDYSSSSNTGNRSSSSNTGYYSSSSNTGDCSSSSNTGSFGSVSVDGKDSVGVAWGYKSRIKGCLGSTLVLSYWEFLKDNINSSNTLTLINTETIKIDGENYKPDTWYIMTEDGVVEWNKDIYRDYYID